ncbi:twin-arginine translocation protein, TatA/E family protein [Oceanicola granulosus HTCC2516]|uniref:Sec-independent protein translocase protein TatA n=1 Tax=Oceanicola granulosus (strain ATCC BAA-861 / DSM 15982 / KCTC 12143 / HTCC2516) TaxID=314256 RepID=Q2CFR9_OCEGH|nr:twin-arginine translocase TatA/TatE family subunit [Oceanicola granulosus]EAR51623.1 twin-arginine translocation protein, TatA/E family protein [Oceanicola granulosus HTCC2516]
MLNNIGLPGLLLIAVVVLVLFGRGKISSLMGEVGKGITAFKRGVEDGKNEINASLEDDDDKSTATATGTRGTTADTAHTARDVTPEEEKERV